ncbi:ABC transporter permease [Candidatus Uhrbacteria bacterium]|jgi:ABC-2 type transport system permease protein|nr:ABC transporter permease [Candidatus Uhrbacteria bacterium]
MNWIGLYTLVRRDIERIFRVPTQIIISPWISALLYIFIFGYVIGGKIDLIAGVSYISFVFPGILMMNIMSAGFSHSAFGIYFHRFAKSIEEILVAPLSYGEILLAYIIGSIFRASIVGAGIYVIAILFGIAQVEHLGLLAFYIASVGTVFALAGMIVGLWAKSFEQLGVVGTYVITPLSFVGGIFYSVSMLPERVQAITYVNPFFYFIDGLRYSMIGVSESNRLIGVIMIISLIVSLFAIVWHLLRIGWGIRT